LTRFRVAEPARRAAEGPPALVDLQGKFGGAELERGLYFCKLEWGARVGRHLEAGLCAAGLERAPASGSET